MNLRGGPLTKSDLASLENRWITPELAEQSLFRHVASNEGGPLVGRNGSGDYEGIVIHYVWPGEDSVRGYRLRRARPEISVDPETGKRKEKSKYLASPGDSNRLYVPIGVEPSWLADRQMPVLIVEGEFKATALFRLALHALGDAAELARFLPISIPGVGNWQGVIGKTTNADGERVSEKGPIPDLKRIEWRGRQVVIIFDRDLETNKHVIFERFKLGLHLQRQGAKVRVFQWPKQNPGAKGVDDLLSAAGPDLVLNLIDAAPAFQSKAKKAPRLMEGSAIMEATITKQEYAVEHILATKSMTLISGAPKAGKSAFMLEVAAAVMDGRPFLGCFPANQGKVLYWAADDPDENRFYGDFQKLKPRHPENFVLWPERVPLDSEGLEMFDKLLTDHKPVLTVVDNLTCIRPRRKSGSDVSQDDYDQTRMILNLAVKHNTAIGLLHHKATARKSGDAWDAVAGSYGVGAGTGDAILLDRIEHGRTERYIRGQGRNVEDLEFIYARDDEKRFFMVCRGSCCRYWRNVIYPLAIRDDKTNFGAKEVAEEAGLSMRAAYLIIQHLRIAGAIEKVAPGEFALDGDLLQTAIRLHRLASGAF